MELGAYLCVIDSQNIHLLIGQSFSLIHCALCQGRANSSSGEE